jgi:hypothetical protein
MEGASTVKGRWIVACNARAARTECHVTSFAQVNDYVVV